MAIMGGWAVTGYFTMKWFNGRDCWCGSGPVVPCSGWLCCFNPVVLAPFRRAHEAYMRLLFGPHFFDEAEEGEDECVEARERLKGEGSGRRVAGQRALAGVAGASTSFPSPSSGSRLTSLSLPALLPAPTPTPPPLTPLCRTGGRTYDEIREEEHLRKRAYLLTERTQLHPKRYDLGEPPPVPQTGPQFLAARAAENAARLAAKAAPTYVNPLKMTTSKFRSMREMRAELEKKTSNPLLAAAGLGDD